MKNSKITLDSRALAALLAARPYVKSFHSGDDDDLAMKYKAVLLDEIDALTAPASTRDARTLHGAAGVLADDERVAHE